MSLAQLCVLKSPETITREIAWDIVGGLSRTKKMPSWSYGLPAEHCGVGRKLRLVPGSVCWNCYGFEGQYPMPQVSRAQMRRAHRVLRAITVSGERDKYINAFVYLLRRVRTFRWHDTGDLYNRQHLELILEIVRRTPHVQHWLPTKEYKLINSYRPSDLPSNLCLRVSAPMVDGKPPKTEHNTSTVHDQESPQGYECPGECKPNDCLACWDKSIINVSYKLKERRRK